MSTELSEDPALAKTADVLNTQQCKVHGSTINQQQSYSNYNATSGQQVTFECPWLVNEGGFGPFVPAEKERILECRRVTDLWVTPVGCAILLWMFYTTCLVLGVGDSRRLSHGYDYKGRLCGVDLPSEPYVYWPPHPITNTIDLISPICIKKCPKQKDVDNGMNVSYPNRTTTIETLPDGRESIHVIVQPVDVPAYPSRQFGSEYCFPLDFQKSDILAKALGLTDGWMVVTRVFKSIQTGWSFLVLSGIIAVICSFTYLLLIADIAWIICWVTSSAAPISLLFGSLYLGITAATVNSSVSIPALVAVLDWIPVRGLLIGSAITGVIISIFLFFSDAHLKQHSRVAVAMSQTASHCLWSVPSILLYPFIGTVIAVFVWFIGIIVFIGLLTSPAAVPKPHLLSNEMIYNQTSLDPSLFIHPLAYPPPDTIAYSIVTHVNNRTIWDTDIILNQRRLKDSLEQSETQLGLLRQFHWDLGLHWSCLLWVLSILWLLELVHNLTQFVISLTAAMWYFTIPDIRGKRDDVGVTGPICLWVGIRYHLGTLQFSAFILTIFRWLQFASWALRQKIETALTGSGRQIRFCSFFLSFFQCVLQCLEDTSQFSNTSGLIDCVLYSNDFFISCRRAWILTHRQIPSVIMLGRINSLLSLLNSIGLASTMSGIVLYITSKFPVFYDPSSTWFIESPVGLAAATFGLVVVIGRLVVFSFDQLSSTLLYCFLVESQSQSGVVVFAPDELRVLIEEQETERRLVELQRAMPDRSILSLSMLAASRGSDTLDELISSNMKGNEEGWRETIRQFKDDGGLYQEGGVGTVPGTQSRTRRTQSPVDGGPGSLRSLMPKNHSQLNSNEQHQQQSLLRHELRDGTSALEMNDVRW